MMTLIRNGLVVAESKVIKADLLIQEGRIAGLDQSIPIADAGETIDASGKIIFPGMIDVHTHFQWGYLENRTVDTFSLGTGAAVRGGVTTIIDFCLQAPGSSLSKAVSERRRQMEGESYCDYSLHIILTDFSEASIKEIPEMIVSGYPSYKLFMSHSSSQRVASLESLAKIAKVMKEHNGIFGVHAEKEEIVRKETANLLAQGNGACSFFPMSRPSRAEIEAIREVLKIAEITMSPLHIFHLTTAEGLKLVAEAKSRGVPVFVETCPHYLFFSEDVYGGERGELFLVNPPLRGTEDIQALWRGLQERKINIVSSDHCAFSVKQKKTGANSFVNAPAGLAGTELLFPLFYTEAKKKGFTLGDIADLLSKNPAQIFGLWPRKGSIHIGADADLVIYDPAQSHNVHASDLHMGSDFSPYEGFVLEGGVERTFLRGKTIFSKGQMNETGGGRFITRFIDPGCLQEILN